MKADELKNRSQLHSKCTGVTSSKDDRNGNAWLYNTNLLKPSRFLTVFRLRGCVTSDKVTRTKWCQYRPLNAGNTKPAMQLSCTVLFKLFQGSWQLQLPSES